MAVYKIQNKIRKMKQSIANFEKIGDFKKANNLKGKLASMIPKK